MIAANVYPLSLFRNPPMRFMFTLMLTCLILGCAPATGTETESGSNHAAELDEQRLMLNEGYSLLYIDAGYLDLAELILYMKVESDEFEELITAVAEFGGKLQVELERIAKDYPDVHIDLDPLPEMEKRKRRAVGKYHARYFAPGIGHSGREYEHTVLIGIANKINHERHLCQVMAEEEPDAGLRKFLLDTSHHYDDLYNRTAVLLDKEYNDSNDKT
jgi:hypothetical protein